MVGYLTLSWDICVTNSKAQRTSKKTEQKKCEIQWIEECVAKRCLLDLNSQATPVPQHFVMRGVRAMRPPPLLEGLLSVPSGAYLVLKWCSHCKLHYLQQIPSPMLGKNLTELMKSS